MIVSISFTVRVSADSFCLISALGKRARLPKVLDTFTTLKRLPLIAHSIEQMQNQIVKQFKIKKPKNGGKLQKANNVHPLLIIYSDLAWGRRMGNMSLETFSSPVKFVPIVSVMACCGDGCFAISCINFGPSYFCKCMVYCNSISHAWVLFPAWRFAWRQKSYCEYSGIVDQNVQATMLALDDVTRRFNAFLVRHIHLQKLDVLPSCILQGFGSRFAPLFVTSWKWVAKQHSVRTYYSWRQEGKLRGGKSPVR